ncbi:hypothetical protein [Oryzibacter oryziterrae]|uniref:hypothetical protein n=1 Tax=Oryzibacter oryziterrae TaxID=2766474 RepID=UPI001F1DBDB7|nr:hypothetical protein [Oryzibacter oryziterrae]
MGLVTRIMLPVATLMWFVFIGPSVLLDTFFGSAVPAYDAEIVKAECWSRWMVTYCNIAYSRSERPGETFTLDYAVFGTKQDPKALSLVKSTSNGRIGVAPFYNEIGNRLGSGGFLLVLTLLVVFGKELFTKEAWTLSLPKASKAPNPADRLRIAERPRIAPSEPVAVQRVSMASTASADRRTRFGQRGA